MGAFSDRKSPLILQLQFFIRRHFGVAFYKNGADKIYECIALVVGHRTSR